MSALLLAFVGLVGQHQEHATLVPPPKDLPAWMSSRSHDEISYKQAAYNFDIRAIDALSRDLNAVAVGHSMAYEDLVTGKAASLETETFNRIDWVLKHPPKNMPAERFISPSFARRYPALEKVFDWTHVLHAQTVDVLASPDLSLEAKEKEIEALWRFYKSAPYTVTGLPMNMDHLDSQPYSMAFRKKYPKVNGLFWGYHWLQGAMYDLLYGVNLKDAGWQYEMVGERYRETELYKTDRDFMPMFAELSPRFSRRFPELANAFDNLHMLHDMVNDILASDWMTEKQKEDQITRAIWMVSDHAHRGEKPGNQPSEISNQPSLHDHRFMGGQPGMGMMKMSTPELMYMPGMGWMSMSDCGHCAMPMNFDPKSGAGATVSMDSWTMDVRCALCARDMAAQSPGRAIIRAYTEDPSKLLVLISDDEGNWTSNIPDVVFLEVEGEHPNCFAWSRAFTTRAAFDAYVREDEELKDAKPLSLKEWAALAGKEPDLTHKKQGPVPNPYKPEGK